MKMARDKKWLRIAACLIGAVTAFFAIAEISYLVSVHHFESLAGGFIAGLLMVTYTSVTYAIKSE
jgi:hypothetical protein